MNMENHSQNYLLITTAIEETWGHTDQKAVLLGEWCKTMQNEGFLKSKNYEQIAYHWADREKFIKDYEYLELFYERVLESLSESLNQYHQTQHSLRYWSILLGPWLLTYVATAWDRWESLRMAFNNQDSYTIFTLNQDQGNCIPEDYNTFKVYNTIDEWNEHLFLEIIKYQYNDQVNVNLIMQGDNSSIKKNFIIEQKEPTKSKLIRFIDSCFALIQNNYKVVFVEPYFDRYSLLSLSFRLKQLPRRHYEFFQTVDYPSVNQERFSRNIDIQTTNDFEEFFQQHIFSQIPIAYLEGFQELNRVASSIKTNGDIIFTANAHLDNDLFNCWTGSQVEAGKRLVVSQHGGAIRSNFTNFDHQEKIADTMTVWHKPYMSNQVQLTPNKMIRMKKMVKKNKDKLTLVGFETCRYPYRAQASPTADTYIDDYDQKITFANALNQDIYEELTVRCFNYKHGGTSSKDRYIRDLGIEKLGTEKTIQDAFSHSKLVVCTYPQTTFSEAMHLNIPTILLFCEEHWPLHPQFDDLIEQLKRNKIIFTDPLEAAEHINQVWDNPDEWWLDPSTRRAVEYFFEMCGTVSDNWVEEWVSFFRSENTYLSNDEKDIIKHDYGIDLYTRIRLIFMNSIKKFIQLFLPLFRTKIGRVILEMVATDMIAHTRSISHNDTALSFVEINRLTKFRIDTFSTKEPETLNWIDHFDKDKVFWDIGANVGLYTCYAAKKNRCITAAFEPSVFNLELLARNISINNLNDLVTIIPLPLTEIIKTSNMNMSDTAQGHALSTFGENYGSDGKLLSSSFAYQMIGLSMDDAVNIFKLPAPNYIKIDVDGIEHLILKGGEGVLNNAESILIEINDAFIEQSEASNKYLTNSGFILKEKKHAEYYDNIKLYTGIEKTTYNQIWIKKN